jgi:hypothetical protein
LFLPDEDEPDCDTAPAVEDFSTLLSTRSPTIDAKVPVVGTANYPEVSPSADKTGADALEEFEMFLLGSGVKVV